MTDEKEIIGIKYTINDDKIYKTFVQITCRISSFLLGLVY
jgi:hypothetical protein